MPNTKLKKKLLLKFLKFKNKFNNYNEVVILSKMKTVR
jgi:hypothetical protein